MPDFGQVFRSAAVPAIVIGERDAQPGRTGSHWDLADSAKALGRRASSDDPQAGRPAGAKGDVNAALSGSYYHTDGYPIAPGGTIDTGSNSRNMI